MNRIEEWLEGLAVQPAFSVDTGQFFLATLVSLAVSAIVIGLYKVFYSRPESGSDIQRAFLLLGPSVTAMFLSIQFSIPLSLGLFGVFAIVRFRNPVRDPEELGFLMLLLASSVIVATLQFHLLLILLAVVTAALAVRYGWARLPHRRRQTGLYVVSLDAVGEDTERRAIEVLRNEVPNPRIETLSYTQGTLTIHCGFQGEGTDTLRLDKRLREVAPVHQIDLFLTRSGPS